MDPQIKIKGGGLIMLSKLYLEADLRVGDVLVLEDSKVLITGRELHKEQGGIRVLYIGEESEKA